MTRELTYYCGERVFLSFLKSKQLWLTSLSQSNDSAEGRWMKDYWLEQFLGDRSPENRLLRRGARVVLDMVSHDSLALGVCFSEEHDLLSQWRGYADDGTGYSITFKTEGLQKLASQNLANGLTLTKIAYGGMDHSEINAIVKKLADTFIEDAAMYTEDDSGVGDLLLDSGPNGEKHALRHDAARLLFTVKNGAFSEEKEWRLFTYGSLRSFEGVQFRGNGKAISPYIPLSVPPEVVSRITLGPVNQTPEHVLKFALKSHGFSRVGVSFSDASYQSR